MKPTFSPIAFAVLLLGAGLSPARAQGTAQPGAQMACPASARRDSRDGLEGPMAGRLKLTEAQKASLQTIRARHQEALAARDKAAGEARRAFFEAERRPGTAPEALKALNRTLADAEFDRRQEHRALREEMRAALTPEQREQAARMEGFRQGMRQARGGPRPDGPPVARQAAG